MQQSILYLANGLTVYIGNLQQTKTHEHHAMQIIISMEGAMRLKVDDEQWGDYHALILSSNGSHECVAANIQKIVINLDPQSKISLQIKKIYLSGKKYHILSAADIRSVINNLKILLTIQLFLE